MKEEIREQNRDKTHYVYIVECADKSLYTGWTTCLEKRMRAHNEGKGAKYTKAKRPVCLRYYEQFTEKSDALRRECEIKKLPREKKLLLIHSGQEKETIQNDGRQRKKTTEETL